MRPSVPCGSGSSPQRLHKHRPPAVNPRHPMTCMHPDRRFLIFLNSHSVHFTGTPGDPAAVPSQPYPQPPPALPPFQPNPPASSPAVFHDAAHALDAPLPEPFPDSAPPALQASPFQWPAAIPPQPPQLPSLSQFVNPATAAALQQAAAAMQQARGARSRGMDSLSPGGGSENRQENGSGAAGGTQASKSCHFCCRASFRGPYFECGNVARGLCRKILCSKCFEKNGWDFEGAVRGCAVCPHCSGTCPTTARCYVYAKHNAKRSRRRKGSNGQGNSGPCQGDVDATI